MVDDVLLGVVHSRKMARYAYLCTCTQRKGIGPTSKNGEWMHIYMF